MSSSTGWWGRLWSLLYIARAPWDIKQPRPELVSLVEEGRVKPCRAIDLGCGTGENVIYLARQGFDITGTDISPMAIAKARRRARIAGVSPVLFAGDVTNLIEVEGPFDLVVDNGCLHSLPRAGSRDKYIQTLLRLTRPGSQYFMRCFIRKTQVSANVSFHMEPGEVEKRFSREFEIEELEPMQPKTDIDAVFLMRRK